MGKRWGAGRSKDADCCGFPGFKGGEFAVGRHVIPYMGPISIPLIGEGIIVFELYILKGLVQNRTHF